MLPETTAGLARWGSQSPGRGHPRTSSLLPVVGVGSCLVPGGAKCQTQMSMASAGGRASHIHRGDLMTMTLDPDDPDSTKRSRSISAANVSGMVSTGDRAYNVISTFSPALEEVSKADPENIQQVGAAQLSLSTSYYQNVLDQARRSFMAAIISAAVGLAFFIAAVSILLIRNDVRAGTVSAISGAVVELISGLNFWLYGRTAYQMNFFHIRLEQTQKYLLANSLATKLSGDNRDAALMDLIRQVSSSPVFNADLPRDSD